MDCSWGCMLGNSLAMLVAIDRRPLEVCVLRHCWMPLGGSASAAEGNQIEQSCSQKGAKHGSKLEQNCAKKAARRQRWAFWGNYWAKTRLKTMSDNCWTVLASISEAFGSVLGSKSLMSGIICSISFGTSMMMHLGWNFVVAFVI